MSSTDGFLVYTRSIANNNDDDDNHNNNNNNNNFNK